jgi:hypothetical protein
MAVKSFTVVEAVFDFKSALAVVCTPIPRRREIPIWAIMASSFVVAMIGAYAAAATGIEPSRVLAQG